MNLDMNFLKELLSKGVAVVKSGFSVLTSEISFVKYLYTYGKHIFNMAKSLSGDADSEE